MTHTEAQRHKSVSDLCKESKVFKQALTAMLRDELSYCSRTGKIHSIIKVADLDDATYIDIKKTIY